MPSLRKRRVGSVSCIQSRRKHPALHGDILDRSHAEQSLSRKPSPERIGIPPPAYPFAVTTTISGDCSEQWSTNSCFVSNGSNVSAKHSGDQQELVLRLANPPHWRSEEFPDCEPGWKPHRFLS